MITKQFVALFVLVVIAVIAIATFTNIAIFETFNTYDLSELIASIFSFLNTLLSVLGEQDAAVDGWIDEATVEVQQVEAELFFWNNYVFGLINS